jgi:hypothetical protein
MRFRQPAPTDHCSSALARYNGCQPANKDIVWRASDEVMAMQYKEMFLRSVM